MSNGAVQCWNKSIISHVDHVVECMVQYYCFVLHWLVTDSCKCRCLLPSLMHYLLELDGFLSCLYWQDFCCGTYAASNILIQNQQFTTIPPFFNELSPTSGVHYMKILTMPMPSSVSVSKHFKITCQSSLLYSALEKKTPAKGLFSVCFCQKLTPLCNIIDLADNLMHCRSR